MASERETNAAHRQLAAITLWGEQWRQHAPSFDAAWVDDEAEPTPATAHRFSPLLLGIARRYAAVESAAYASGVRDERNRCVSFVRGEAASVIANRSAWRADEHGEDFADDVADLLGDIAGDLEGA